MVTFTNECVCCPTEMGCLGDSCPNRNVAHYICDSCGDEFDADELYDVDGEHFCKDCLCERFPTVKELQD